MKTYTALAASLIAAMLVGCASNGGPAETTIDPMKNVGPLTVKETKTEIKDGKTNIVIFERKESPESGQVGLRKEELRSRNAGNGVLGRIFRGGGHPDYYWQSQLHHGGHGPVPPIGGYHTGGGGGGYYGGTRP